MSEIPFELSDNLDYQDGGENKTSNKLVFTAPSKKTRKYTYKLRQLFFRAAASLDTKKDSSKNSEQDKQEKTKETDYVPMFYASSVDFEDVVSAFEELLISGHCKIEGKVDLTSYHLEQIEPDDLERIMGVYLHHFLLSSWMDRLMGNS